MRTFSDYHEENLEMAMAGHTSMLLTFTGPGCVPCRMMKEALKEKREISGIPIYSVSIEDAPALADQFMVMGVPTTVMIENNIETGRHVGMMNYDQLKQKFAIGVI